MIRGRVTPAAYLRALPLNQAGSKIVKPVIVKAGNAVGAGNLIGAGLEGLYDSMSSGGSSNGPPGGHYVSPMCMRLGC